MAPAREKIVQAAERLVGRGKVEAAIREYRKVLAENPRDINTLNRVGDLYARLERIDEAVGLFSRIAEHYTEDGFFVKAIAIYKKIIKLDPTRLDIYERLAELYHRQGLVNEARTQYQVLVDYYQKHGDKDAAINICRRMLELEPGNPSHRAKLADLLEQQGKTSEAMAEYRAIAEHMLASGQAEAASRVYEKALGLDAEDLGFLTDAVLKLKEAGSLAAAARLLSAAVQRNPRAEQVMRLVGGAELAAAAAAAAAKPQPFARKKEKTAVEPAPAPAPPRRREEAVPPPARSEAAAPPAVEPPRPAPPPPAPPPAAPAREPAPPPLPLKKLAPPPAVSPAPPAAKVPPPAAAPAARAPVRAEEEPEDTPSSAEIDLDFDADGAFVFNLEDDEVPASLVTPPPDMVDRPPRPPAEIPEFRPGLAAAPGSPAPAAPDAPSPPTLAAPASPPAAAAAAEEGEEEFDLALSDLEPGVSFDLAEASRAAMPPVAEEPAPPSAPAAGLAPFLREAGEPPGGEFLLPEIEEISAPDEASSGLEGPLTPLQQRLEEALAEAAEAAPGETAEGEGVIERDLAELLAEEEMDLQIDADFLDRTAAELEPARVEQEEDLVTEAEVLAKYGLRDKAFERLRDLFKLNPRHLGAYGLQIALYLEEGRHERVAFLASEMAAIAAEAGQPHAWDQVRRRLAKAGYQFEGDRRVLPPAGGAAAPEAEPPMPGAAERAILPPLELEPPEVEAPELAVDDLAEISFDEILPALDLPPAAAPAAELAAPRVEPPAPRVPAPRPAPAAPEPARSRRPPAAKPDVDALLAELTTQAHPPAGRRRKPAPLADATPPAGLWDLTPSPAAPPAPPPGSAPDLEAAQLFEPQPETPAAEPGEEVLEGIEIFEAEPEAASIFEDTGTSWLDEVSAPAAAGGDEKAFSDEQGFFDLAAELEQELKAEEGFSGEGLFGQPHEQTLEEIVEGFKRGVSDHLSAEDYETHFNLGIAYREMGLLDEAIGEFQLAAKDAGRLVDCCSMLGMCFLEKGLPELAVKWYRRGLEHPELAEDESLGLLYDLGTAYVALGDRDNAYRTFVEIYGINTNYRDVVARLQELAP